MIEIKDGVGNFYIGNIEENPNAEVTYVLSGTDKIIIDHTFVSDELSGQSIGKRLIKKVIDFARQEKDITKMYICKK